MEEFLSALNVPIPKEQLFLWSPDAEGKIRDKKNTAERLAFVDKLISVQKEYSLKDKNVIVFDDQYTTGATARVLSDKLLNAGVQNVLFLCLFYLANDAPSEKKCGECKKIVQVKYNRTNSNPFFVCTSSEYGGTGCGWKEWIE